MCFVVQKNDVNWLVLHFELTCIERVLQQRLGFAKLFKAPVLAMCKQNCQKTLCPSSCHTRPITAPPPPPPANVRFC